jgi:flagellar hook protein FlgE
MNISSAFSSGLAGYQNASSQLSVSGDRIANAGIAHQNNENEQVGVDNLSSSAEREPISITTELINMKVAELQAKASINVISTADEMVGTLIDTSV